MVDSNFSALMGELLPQPNDAERQRRRDDLLQRAALVRANGWSHYRDQWSTGEVIAVAALLGHGDELASMGESLHSALARWAFDLWGFAAGQADVECDCRRTREWFLDVSHAL